MAIKVVVTGANGLLGRAVLSRLNSAGAEVTAIVRRSPSQLINGVKYLIIDLGECAWDTSVLPASCNAILHFAQSSRFRDFPDSAFDIFDVNVSTTLRLLDYGRRCGADRFIFASSGGVYGRGPTGFNERSPIAQLDELGFYIGSKVCGEIVSQAFVPFMNVSILRYFFIYGAGQNRSMLLPRLAAQIANNQYVHLDGNDGIRINPIHVLDAAEATVAAMEATASQIVNVAGPEVLSIRQIAEIIGATLNRTPRFRINDGVPSDLIGDTCKMHSELIVATRKFEEYVSDVIKY